MVHIYDLEVYPNLFVGIFKKLKDKKGVVYIIWHHDDKYIIDDRKDLLIFLQSGPQLVGYANLGYDAQILEYMIKNPGFNLDDIKELSDKAVNSKWPIVPQWRLSTHQLDLYKIWHYDNNARRTSLKWLEFMFRMKSIKDLPYPIDKIITSQRQVDAVVSYCHHDIKPTQEFFGISKTRIAHRQRMTTKFNIDMMNSSDSAMGESLILNALSINLNIPVNQLKEMRTQRDSIDFSDAIFSYYPDLPITKHVKEDYFKPIIIHSTINPETGNKIFNFKAVEAYHMDWQDMKVVYAMGGIHGCVPKGVYESDDEFVIKSCDVVSEYPNIIVNNNIYPEHLGPAFTSIYKTEIVDERAKWPKSIEYMLNQMYKLGANAAYGKFNSEFSGLYDPLCSVKITINGQLSKTLLGEILLMKIPGSRLLMMNTDGLEIIIPRIYEDLYLQICADWENLTKLRLEHTNYKKLVIDNVNNYIGIYEDDTVKRKGKFYIWEDYLKHDEYHKNASGVIIPEAIYEYFHHGIPPDTTVKECTDIFKFCYGAKKQKGFNHAVLIADDNRRVTVKKNSDRVLRYYMGSEKPASSVKYKSGTLCKLWKDGRLTTINKDGLVIPLQSIRSLDIKKYPNIDMDWYINEAYKIINEIEHMYDSTTKN